MSDRSRHRNNRRGPSYVPLLSQPAREHPAQRGKADVHICPRCRSELVQPVEWGPVGTSRWRVELRCPECPHRSTEIYPQHVLERFDARLDAATEALLADLARLERENMEHEVDAFVEAIAKGWILPEDF